MAGLGVVYLPHPGLRRIILQVVGVRPRPRRQARLAGAMMARPERVTGMQDSESLLVFQLGQERLAHILMSHFPTLILPPLSFVSDDQPALPQLDIAAT